MKDMREEVKRNDIIWVSLDTGIGSEQAGDRPAVVIQNDVGNKYSTVIIVAMITSQINKAKLPTHVEVSKDIGLDKDSVIMTEQLRTISKKRIREYIGRLNDRQISQLDRSLLISLGITNTSNCIAI